jgi:hypothetical protein
VEAVEVVGAVEAVEVGGVGAVEAVVVGGVYLSLFSLFIYLLLRRLKSIILNRLIIYIYIILIN